MINDDDSSEGIVASSDDEHVGLSEAVEYHIFSQASHAREDKPRLNQRRPLKSHDDDRGGIWREPRSPEFYEKRFRYQEDYHSRRLDEDIRNRQRPLSPYQRPPRHHYGAEDPPPSRAPPPRYYDAPQSRTTHEVPLPPMHRQPMTESERRRHRERAPSYPPIPPRNVYPGEKASVRHAHEGLVGFSGSHYMPNDRRFHDTDHRVKDTDHRIPRSKIQDDGRERSSHHEQYRQSLSNMYRDRNLPPRLAESVPQLGNLINESLHKFEKKTEKLPPKPICFKVKSAKSEENSFHPLDRLAPAFKNDKVSSPGRWLHDRYDDKESDAAQETPGDVEPEKVSKDKLCEDSVNPTNLEQLQENISTSQNSNSILQQSGSPEGLIHAKKHSDTVCDVETIIEEGECVEENKTSESSDEDEELLGLRLKALSSALAEDKKTRSVTKKKSRKRRLKNLIHRVHDTPQADKKNPGRSKRSGDAESILGRPSYDKSKSVRPKTDPKQLTLLGEMVKNHHPTEVLKKIKSKPEVRQSSQSPTNQQKSQDQVTISKEVANKPEQTVAAVNNSKNDQVDNYDEMEMDLELEDSESDSGLLPPGVDQTPLEESVAQVSSSADVIKSSSVEKGVKRVGNNTPTQESIWSMLEHASVHSDSHSNAEDNPEKEKIVKVPILESRRTSFEDFDDDDAIMKLRQSLLRQLDKNVKNDDADDRPLFDAGKSAPLPSQFPYKPPQLRIISAAVSTTAPSVSTLSTSTVPAVTTSAISCIETSTVQATPITSAGDMQAMTPSTISTSICSHDSSPKAFADTSITVQPVRNEVSANTPRVFLPQTASTPAVNSHTPALRKAANRRRRRRKSSAAANIEALSQKGGVAVKSKQLSNILKPAVTNVAIVSKPSLSHSTASKTLVKTATTIIRSTGIRSTTAAVKSVSSPNKETLLRMKSIIDRPKPLLQLPRHQPVVVNIGSSDEEESTMSPDKHSVSPNDPIQMQRDKVNEMVEQMRILATARQNATTKGNDSTAPNSFHSNLNSSALVSPSQKLSNAAKKLRLRFLKLGALIKKDQIKFNQVMTAKAAKKVELKATEDELKQMLHRIAAIKSKKAKCEGILGQYSKQEKIIKSRLQKRNTLIKAVGEKLQSQLKRSKESIVPPAKPKHNVLVGKTTSPTSHPTSSTVTKLDMEKQRLLARQQKLAEKISQMKKTEGAVDRKRSMLSNEVQSSLAKYRKTRTSSNPTAHDLSLNKIVISVPSPVNISPEKSSNEDARKKIEGEKSPKSLKTDQPTTEDSIEQTSISDSSLKLRSIVTSQITRYQPFASYNPVLSYDAEPFTTKFWEQSTPVSIQKWRLTGTEILTGAKAEESQALGLVDATYQSPLRLFRSYRLNPYLRVKEKLSIKSATFSHKIDARKIMCRYELSGKCQDPNCKGQHSDQYLLTNDELMVDLLLYCPSLFGKSIASETPQDSLIEMARSACLKLVGVGTTQKNMSVDERCILVASRINSSLGNKAPHTTIFKPRSTKLTQDKKKSLILPVTIHKEKVEVESAHEENGTEEPDSGVEQIARYFVEDGNLDMKKLEDAVNKDRKNTQLWLRLTEKTMKTKDSNRLELALHTMCLALEENAYSGELWAYYLNLLHERNGRQWSEDLDEMVAEAIEIIPLSTYIWNLLLSWENNAMKMGILLDQLVSNIIKFVELEGSQEEYTPEFLSSWLLETLLRKVQLAFYRSGADDALDQFSQMIDSCAQQRFWAITNSGRHCLLPNDFCILKLCFINFKHFKCLPRCFLPDIRPLDFTGMMHAVKIYKNIDVQMDFSSSVKLGDIFSSLLSDVNDSIEDCQIGADVSMACFQLLWEKLRLLKAQECWDDAASLSRLIHEKVQQSLETDDLHLRFGFSVEKLKKILCDCIIISADCLAKLGNIHEATQVFENAISDNKSVDGKLCFEAALLQSSVDSEDIEAVLGYLEACVSSFVKSESDCLNANDLKLMLRHLLQLPFPKKQKIPEFIDGVSWATVNKAKPSLWLMYSLLMRTTGASNEVLFHLYEQAITDVADLSSKRELWLRYIRYRQAVALSLSDAGKAKQQRWMRNFSFLVKRCLTSMSPQLPLEDVESRDCYYSDYTFHNQVSAVYLSCFSTRQLTASAYNFLVEIMPYNLLLILRACKFHLSHGDHLSVISTVWKITANTKCQNETLWKM